jgi:hypothetical protein
MIEYDPHRTVSFALSEIRTVGRRAATALRSLENSDITNQVTWTVEGARWERDEDGKPRFVNSVDAPHPDTEEIITALRRITELTKPWRRIGRP